ncbi:hypothetical protein CRG98_046180 [Punica granatum]|uniref:Uncharacterized protein n=1 Tax=Punica granatum TaxID=22663 RepID=A0A2I0HNV6_PUNGR|nr:hypothetical protein CRG98_046180 [Punica granatum]
MESNGCRCDPIRTKDGKSDVVSGVKYSEITDEDSDYDPKEDDDYVGLEDDDYQSTTFDNEFVEATRNLRLYRQGQDVPNDEQSNDQQSWEGEDEYDEDEHSHDKAGHDEVEHKYLERFRENPEWSINELASNAQRRFAIIVSKSTKYRTKAIALNTTHGSLGKQYNMLPSYVKEIRKARSKPIIDILEYVSDEKDGQVDQRSREGKTRVRQKELQLSMLLRGCQNEVKKRGRPRTKVHVASTSNVEGLESLMNTSNPH